MKKALLVAAAFAAFAVCASVLELVTGNAEVANGGKLEHVEAISTVVAGTVTVKAETQCWTNAVEVTELAPVTNVSYVLVYSNGVNVVTNSSPSPVDFRYIGNNYISYETNTVVFTPAITQGVLRVAITVTNTVSTFTCSAGYGANSPENAWIPPGAKVWFEGTARGRVWLFTR